MVSQYPSWVQHNGPTLTPQKEVTILLFFLSLSPSLTHFYNFPKQKPQAFPHPENMAPLTHRMMLKLNSLCPLCNNWPARVDWLRTVASFSTSTRTTERGEQFRNDFRKLDLIERPPFQSSIL